MILFSLSVGLRECMDDVCILTARDGKEAVDMLQSRAVDFIVTDMHMPVMNGYDFIASVHRSHPRIPIIVMSSGYLPSAAPRFRPGTVRGYLLKPVEISLLASAISSILDHDERSPALSGIG